VADFSWFRLSHDWSERDWLQGVSPIARVLWPVFLGKIRAANSSGVFKKLGLVAMSKAQEIDLCYFHELWEAALSAGEIVDQGGDLFLLRDREIVMSPDAIRKEREREEKRMADLKKQGSRAKTGQTEKEPAQSDQGPISQADSEHGQTSPDTSGQGQPEQDEAAHDRYTKQIQNKLSTANAVGEQQPAEQETPAEESSSPDGSPPKRSRAPDARFERLRSIITRCHEAMNFAPPTDADVRRELKATSTTLAGLLVWLEELPRARWLALAESVPSEFAPGLPTPDDAAVAMWVLCRRTWAGAVTWPAIYGQRDTIIAKLAASRTRSQGALEQADDLAAAMDARLAGSGGGYGRS
jgi:hypothetical protein